MTQVNNESFPVRKSANNEDVGMGSRPAAVRIGGSGSCDSAAMVNIKRRMLLSVFRQNRGTVRDTKKVGRRYAPRAESTTSSENSGYLGEGVLVPVSRLTSASSTRSNRPRQAISTQKIFETELDFSFSSEEEEELYTDESGQPFTNEDDVVSSRSTYKAACQSLDIVPANYFLQNLHRSSLAMRHHVLGPTGAKACAIALVNNTRVKHLDLGANNVQCRGAIYLSEMLTANETITSLTLSDNNIGSTGLHALSTMLKDNIVIKKLSLSGNGFAEHDAHCIADLLENNHVIEDLDLSHNCFSDRGGDVIGCAIANNRTVLNLDLSWNHLRGRGGVALAEGIKSNKYLREVDLSWNGLSMDGCVGIGSMLEYNQTLVSLDLTNNRINKEHLVHILRGLKRNVTLASLKLGLNPLSSDGARLILEVLQQCPDVALVELDLTGQCVDDKFIDMLEEIQKTRVLSVIYDIVLHQSDIGQKAEGFLNEDPMMVLMEFMRQKNMRLVDLFTKLDADGSKSLSRKEFKDGLLAVNIPLSSDGLDKLLDNLDKDGDGEVDFAELMEGQKEYRRKVTIIQQRRTSTSEEDEVSRINRKVSSLLLATDAVKKAPETGDAPAEQSAEQIKLANMTRKIKTMLKMKNAIHKGGPS